MSGSESPTYPLKTIAKLLKLTERRVQQLAKSGVIPKGARGRYDLVASVQGYIVYLQERAAGPASIAGAIDYHVEKARKTRAEADIAEMEVAKRRGSSIDADEVKRAWQLILAEVRANLLGNTPQRIASRIHGLSDDAQIRRVIRDEIALAMTVAASKNVEELFVDE
jgi:phage terminase Nu1 subunit (DNA packaging protein)